MSLQGFRKAKQKGTQKVQEPPTGVYAIYNFVRAC